VRFRATDRNREAIVEVDQIQVLAEHNHGASNLPALAPQLERHGAGP
jgi:hypothetical protein